MNFTALDLLGVNFASPPLASNVLTGVILGAALITTAGALRLSVRAARALSARGLFARTAIGTKIATPPPPARKCLSIKDLRRFCVFLSASLFITAGNVFAQSERPNNVRDLPRIAVYVTGNVGEDEKTALATRMLASLIRSGRYRGIERSNAFVAELEREQQTQRSGDIDDNQISALGRRFGVKYVCIAAITPAFGEFQVSARIVDVETAEVVHIGEAFSPLRTGRDLAEVSDQVVREMFEEYVRHAPTAQLPEPPPPPPPPPPSAPPPPPEPAPQVVIVHPPASATAPTTAVTPPPQVETRQQTGFFAQRETDHSRFRLVMRVSTAALAVGGIVGGFAYNEAANAEYGRYRDFGSPSEPRGTDAENSDRVREMRRNIDDGVTMRNLLYGLGVIGLAGFAVTLFF